MVQTLMSRVASLASTAVARIAPLKVHLRSVRPSLLDRRFLGDAWILPADEGCSTAYLGDYRLLHIAASPLDLPVLNGLFDRMRHRRPRYCPGSTITQAFR
jgi:hypothetical protein